ncbi:MAG: hypothetical protein M0Q92_05130 [Methanoregula sp.]|nr:hypothetical protein [Methanoregula sp.]
MGWVKETLYARSCFAAIDAVTTQGIGPAALRDLPVYAFRHPSGREHEGAKPWV